jgi:hypothetical protein
MPDEDAVTCGGDEEPAAQAVDKVDGQDLSPDGVAAGSPDAGLAELLLVGLVHGTLTGEPHAAASLSDRRASADGSVMR